MLDPELLKRLAKINQTGSFSKAADCLFVSRQALMSQIRVLENSLVFLYLNGQTMEPPLLSQEGCI